MTDKLPFFVVIRAPFLRSSALVTIGLLIASFVKLTEQSDTIPPVIPAYSHYLDFLKSGAHGIASATVEVNQGFLTVFKC